MLEANAALKDIVATKASLREELEVDAGAHSRMMASLQAKLDAALRENEALANRWESFEAENAKLSNEMELLRSQLDGGSLSDG